MARQRANRTASFPGTTIDKITITDPGSYSVEDEYFAIPAALTLVLDMLPASDVEFWTGPGKSGEQYTIVRAGTPQAGEVLLSLCYMTFHADDEAAPVYATYTGVARVMTPGDFNYLQEEIEAIEEHISTTTANSPGEMIWGGPGTLPAFSLCQIIGHDTAETPVLGLSQSNDPDANPFVMVLSETGQGGTISYPKCAGKITDMTGLPLTGETLYLGTDGKVTWSGEANFPAEGDSVIIVGTALNSTSIWLDITPRRTILERRT